MSTNLLSANQSSVIHYILSYSPSCARAHDTTYTLIQSPLTFKFPQSLSPLCQTLKFRLSVKGVSIFKLHNYFCRWIGKNYFYITYTCSLTLFPCIYSSVLRVQYRFVLSYWLLRFYFARTVNLISVLLSFSEDGSGPSQEEDLRRLGRHSSAGTQLRWSRLGLGVPGTSRWKPRRQGERKRDVTGPRCNLT